MAKVLGDVELRARWYACGKRTVLLSDDTILTPSAKDFIKENGISIERTDCVPERNAGSASEKMSVTSVPKMNGKVVFVDQKAERP